MNRGKLQKMDTSKLIVNPENYRELPSYDVETMMDQIRHSKRVLEPLHIEEETHYVLKGNRRLAACQRLLADPSLPADLKENIIQLDVIPYKGLSAAEKTELILDHGTQKSLTRVETVLAVWRLVRQGYDNLQIMTMLYLLLAKFTNKPAKVHEIEQLKGPERTKALRTWLHGTVSQYIVYVAGFTEEAQQQFILAERKKDRPLTPEEQKQVTFEMNRDAVRDLNACIIEDKKTPEGWNNRTGGASYNALIQKLKDEYANPEKKNGNDRPSVADIEKQAGTMKSQMSVALLSAAGKLDAKDRPKLDIWDTELFRLEQIQKTAQTIVDRVDTSRKFGGGEVRTLIEFFIKGTDADFTKYTERFLQKVEASK